MINEAKELLLVLFELVLLVCNGNKVGRPSYKGLRKTSYKGIQC